MQDRYSELLFTYFVDEEHTRGYNSKEIKFDDTFDIWWNVTTKSTLWQEIFGGFDVKTYIETMQAVVTSGDDDFDISGSDSDIAERFYIAEGDVSDFKLEYEKAQNNDDDKEKIKKYKK